MTAVLLGFIFSGCANKSLIDLNVIEKPNSIEQSKPRDIEFINRLKENGNGYYLMFKYFRETNKFKIAGIFSESDFETKRKLMDNNLHVSKDTPIIDFIKLTSQFWNKNITDYMEADFMPYDIREQNSMIRDRTSVYAITKVDTETAVVGTVLSFGTLLLVDALNQSSGGDSMMTHKILNPNALEYVHKNMYKIMNDISAKEILNSQNEDLKKGYLEIVGSQYNNQTLKFDDINNLLSTDLYQEYLKYAGIEINWKIDNSKTKFILSSIKPKKEWEFTLNTQSKKIRSEEFNKYYGFWGSTLGKFRKNTYEYTLLPAQVKTLQTFQKKLNSEISTNRLDFNGEVLPKNNKIIFEDIVYLYDIQQKRNGYNAPPPSSQSTQNNLSSASNTKSGYEIYDKRGNTWWIRCGNGKEWRLVFESGGKCTNSAYFGSYDCDWTIKDVCK